jgi:hypothetical protein
VRFIRQWGRDYRFGGISDNDVESMLKVPVNNDKYKNDHTLFRLRNELISAIEENRIAEQEKEIYVPLTGDAAKVKKARPPTADRSSRVAGPSNDGLRGEPQRRNEKVSSKPHNIHKPWGKTPVSAQPSVYAMPSVKHSNRNIASGPSMYTYYNSPPISEDAKQFIPPPVGAGYRVPHKPDPLQRNNPSGPGMHAANTIRSITPRNITTGGSNLKRTRKKKLRN